MPPGRNHIHLALYPTYSTSKDRLLCQERSLVRKVVTLWPVSTDGIFFHSDGPLNTELLYNVCGIGAGTFTPQAITPSTQYT